MIIRYKSIKGIYQNCYSLKEMQKYMEKNKLESVYIAYITDSVISPLYVKWDRYISLNDIKGVK